VHGYGRRALIPGEEAFDPSEEKKILLQDRCIQDCANLKQERKESKKRDKGGGDAHNSPCSTKRLNPGVLQQEERSATNISGGEDYAEWKLKKKSGSNPALFLSEKGKGVLLKKGKNIHFSGPP